MEVLCFYHDFLIRLAYLGDAPVNQVKRQVKIRDDFSKKPHFGEFEKAI